MSQPPCDQTAAWHQLQTLFNARGRDFDLRQAFHDHPQRSSTLAVEAPMVFGDLSKHLWDDGIRDALIALAAERGVAERRDAMLRGEAINTTEHRTVRHAALRTPAGAPTDDASAALARTEAAAFMAYAEQIRAEGKITDVVNIGIGGSDLGPQMAVVALHPHVTPGIRFHFVANVDAHDLDTTLSGLNAASTLFLDSSKTFGTRETLVNAQLAMDWARAQCVADLPAHFVGVTANPEAARKHGMGTVFQFWDWVGGRYSMWSAIGLSIAIASGKDGFQAMLDGAHAMDRHFAEAAPAQNLPMLLGLIDVWYRNFHGFGSRSIAPYHHGLRRLPAYLQQLEMESNGKWVDRDGHPMAVGTSPVLWGEPGTNGQHSYFQMLHQGTDRIPVEFIVVAHPDHPHVASHRTLLANALAQSRALMIGRSLEEVLADAGPAPSDEVIAVSKQRAFRGNRPSTTLLIERLDPKTLGALIALHEHRVFTSAAVWGINAFDQWGVELGKTLALDVEARMTDPGRSRADLDSSTASLMKRLESMA
jgi:glucose-6-phosphate isomerase